MGNILALFVNRFPQNHPRRHTVVMMESHKKRSPDEQFLQAKTLELEGTTARSIQSPSSLVEASTAWYWEQDDKYRFIEKTSNHPNEKPFFDLVNFIGKARWEIPGITPLGSSWEAHIAMLEANQPFRDFEYSHRLNDDLIYYFSVSGIPLFDAQNQFTGYIGTAHDISALRSKASLSSHRKGKIICPNCGDLADRIPRRLYDRIVSPFTPLKRYRCHFCDWVKSIKHDSPQ